ncbi:MAG: glutaredoxin [Motiliproteus sp.]|jgi:glutaredoxin
MANIEIYTRPGCHYGAGALKLLQFNQRPYREYNVYVGPQRLAEMRVYPRNNLSTDLY